MKTQTAKSNQSQLRRTLVLALLIVMGVSISSVSPGVARAATPAFQMPFPCGETWNASTYVNHGAIDWNAYPGDDTGRTVVASAAGTASLYWESVGGYQVIIDHSGGWKTIYAHLQQNGRTSGQVIAGQVIGMVGSTGTGVTGAHLHWEQIYNGIKQVPLYANGVALSPGVHPAYTAYISNNCTSSGNSALNLQLSTVGTDGKVYVLGQTSPGTWSPNWSVIDSNVQQTSITTTPDGLQHIAALGGDGNIYVTHQQANKQWGGWSQVQAQVTQVAITATPEGKLHLATRGTDGKVYILSQTSTGGPWSPNWVVIDASNLTSISMTSNPVNGKLHIAVTGNDGNIYVVSQSASTGQWGGWSQVQAQVTQVAITATPEGKLHLATRGTNGKVYVLDETNTGGPWSSNWIEIDGNIMSVAMTSTSNGKLHIASKGGDSNIYVVSQSASTGQWGGWSQVQAQVTQVAIGAA